MISMIKTYVQVLLVPAHAISGRALFLLCPKQFMFMEWLSLVYKGLCSLVTAALSSLFTSAHKCHLNPKLLVTPAPSL